MIKRCDISLITGDLLKDIQVDVSEVNVAHGYMITHDDGKMYIPMTSILFIHWTND
jgi:hypothetical protein